MQEKNEVKEEPLMVHKMQNFVRKQVLKGKHQYSWSNGGEKEASILKFMGELPDTEGKEAPGNRQAKIKSKRYLKFHMMQNAMHDGDREKASSIVQNLVLRTNKIEPYNENK